MRWLPICSSLILTVISLACTATETTAGAAIEEPVVAKIEADPNPVKQADGPEFLFAVVGQTGVEHCPTDNLPSTWLDLQTTLGWIPTSGVADEQLEPLMELPVLARGRSGAPPDRPPLEVEPMDCEDMQMRSDWVNTPRGIRVERSRSPLQHFYATSVRRLDELTVALEGDEVVVSFTNPLPFALAQVELELHYEGCYGKPGSTSRTSEAQTLEPGQTLTHRFVVIAEQDQPGPRKVGKGGKAAREHLASALVLNLGDQDVPNGAPVHADLAVEFGDLGLTLECPDR